MNLSTPKQSLLADVFYEAILLLGSNMGNKSIQLQRAQDLLAGNAGEIIRLSSRYATEPWGMTDQEPFVNQAVMIRTVLSAPELLNTVLRIEESMGRHRDKKWGPRLIDIDILDYNGEIHSQKELTLPHPYLHERMFALIPLKEIAPGWVHPVSGKSINELISSCPDQKKVEVIV